MVRNLFLGNNNSLTPSSTVEIKLPRKKHIKNAPHKHTKKCPTKNTDLENKKKSGEGDGHHSTETEKNAAKEIIWWETDKIIWPWLSRYDPIYWHDMTLKLIWRYNATWSRKGGERRALLAKEELRQKGVSLHCHTGNMINEQIREQVVYKRNNKVFSLEICRVHICWSIH